jgi:hypothetical protein
MSKIDEIIIVNGTSVKYYFLKQDWFMMLMLAGYVYIYTFVFEDSKLSTISLFILFAFSAQQILSPVIISAAFLSQGSLEKMRFYNSSQISIFTYLIDNYLVKSKKIIVVGVAVLLVIVYSFYVPIQIMVLLSFVFSSVLLGVLFYILGLFSSLVNGVPSKLRNLLMVLLNLIAFIIIAIIINISPYIVFFIILTLVLITSYIVYKIFNKQEVVNL